MRLLSKYLASSGVAMVLALTASAVPAGIISGPTVQFITSNSDTSLVLNTGSYVSGKNVGGANTSDTINGVLFKASATGNVFEGPSNTPGNIRYIAGAGNASGIYPNTGSPYASSFSGLLSSTDSIGGGGVREAIVGLNPSLTYRVQLLAGDSRNFSTLMSYRINSGSGGSPGAYTSNNDSLATFSAGTIGDAGANTGFIATFTFNGFSAIDIQNSSAQAFISGISVYQVPEASSFVMLLCGSLGLWRMRRTRTG